MSTSAEALAWAWRQTMPNTTECKIPPTGKYLLVAIAGETHRIDGGPYCAAPGMAKLVRLTGLNESTIVRLIKQLIAAGFMTRERGKPMENGYRSKDVYTLPVVVAASTANPPSDLAPSKLAPSKLASRMGGATQPMQTGTDTDELANLAPCRDGAMQEQVLKDQPPNSPTAESAVGTNSSSVGTAKRGAASRGTRIPDDWRRSPKDIEWQHGKGIPDSFARGETEQFKDWWSSQPGAKGCKLNWSATWRVWMRRAWREYGGGSPQPGGRRQTFTEQRQQQMANENLWMSSGTATPAELQQLRERQAELARQARGSA